MRIFYTILKLNQVLFPIISKLFLKAINSSNKSARLTIQNSYLHGLQELSMSINTRPTLTLNNLIYERYKRQLIAQKNYASAADMAERLRIAQELLRVDQLKQELNL
jgi:hypothetical protein